MALLTPGLHSRPSGLCVLSRNQGGPSCIKARKKVMAFAAKAQRAESDKLVAYPKRFIGMWRGHIVTLSIHNRNKYKALM